MSSLTYYWRVNGNTITDLSGVVVFVAAQPGHRAPDETNAQLNLAQAAPEMLAALERASDMLHAVGSGSEGNQDALRLCHELQALMVRAKFGG